MTDDPSRRIGDYEVLGILGSGGMGKVFKVRNVISDRVEAMKVLLPDLAGRQELADRFLREIKLLASLDHPNIAQLRTALTLSNRLVMVMEYVEGTTLATRLEQGPIPAGEATGYMRQVLSALAYAHSRNVIHRDIKPAHMMLTPSGTVKLMDFGIARASGDASMTVTGTTVGSLYYMSPEQVKGSTVDARSDLYSLGVSLYEMVTGQRPFKATSDYSIMTALLQERPKPPSELLPGLPPQLNGIILHAMAKEPADRFQSADEFSQALDSLGLSASAPVAAASMPAPIPTPIPATAVVSSATTPTATALNTPVPPPLTQPAPIPSVMDMSPKPGKGRGLYMALGAALVLVVLVLAGISFPRWMKTRAAEQKQADQNSSSNQGGSQNSNSTTQNPNSTTSNPPPSDSGNSSSSTPQDSGPNASAGNSTSSDSGSANKPNDSGSSDNSASANSNSGSGDSAKAKSSGGKKQAKSKGSSNSSGNSSGSQGDATASNGDQNNSSADNSSKAQLEELEQDVDQTS